MQDMTTTVCAGANVNDTTQLIDRRDSKKYWVAKLADNNCWMVQNLDLNIPASGLTAALSDMTSDWDASSTYKPVATQAGATPNFTAGTNDVQSWDPGIQICNAAGCNAPIGEDYDFHYLTGNYYSWAAATAGTNGSTGSVCPKNWGLPVNGAYSSLLTSYGTYQSGSVQYGEQVITNPPLYFVRSGYVSGSNLSSAGSLGYYWSSTANNASNAYILAFATSVYPSYNVNRYSGLSVRCVAK